LFKLIKEANKNPTSKRILAESLLDSLKEYGPFYLPSNTLRDIFNYFTKESIDIRKYRTTAFVEWSSSDSMINELKNRYNLMPLKTAEIYSEMQKSFELYFSTGDIEQSFDPSFITKDMLLKSNLDDAGMYNLASKF
jgi:hypothetical protein